MHANTYVAGAWWSSIGVIWYLHRYHVILYCPRKRRKVSCDCVVWLEQAPRPNAKTTVVDSTGARRNRSLIEQAHVQLQFQFNHANSWWGSAYISLQRLIMLRENWPSRAGDSSVNIHWLSVRHQVYLQVYYFLHNGPHHNTSACLETKIQLSREWLSKWVGCITFERSRPKDAMLRILLFVHQCQRWIKCLPKSRHVHKLNSCARLSTPTSVAHIFSVSQSCTALHLLMIYQAMIWMQHRRNLAIPTCSKGHGTERDEMVLGMPVEAVGSERWASVLAMISDQPKLTQGNPCLIAPLPATLGGQRNRSLTQHGSLRVDSESCQEQIGCCCVLCGCRRDATQFEVMMEKMCSKGLRGGMRMLMMKVDTRRLSVSRSTTGICNTLASSRG